MKKYITVLSTMMSISLCTLPSTMVVASQGVFVAPQQIADATAAGIRYYGGTRFKYYPNHLIVADTYNKQVIRNMVELSRSLGWDSVYVRDIPPNLRDYANQYFSDNNLTLNTFAADVQSNYDDDEAPQGVTTYDDPYDYNTDTVYDDNNSVGFFYGGNGGYYGGGGRWNGGGYHGGGGRWNGGGHQGGGGGHGGGFGGGGHGGGFGGGGHGGGFGGGGHGGGGGRR